MEIRPRPVVDAYSHIGLPRFQSHGDALLQMDRAGVDVAFACPFETCPDLAEVHAAMTAAPERIRGFGLPVGRTDTEVEAAVRAQLEAGFVGLRLSGAHVVESPWILDLLGELGGIPLVCGGPGLQAEAPALLRMLDDVPDALVLGGHLASPTDAAVLDDPVVRRLLEHERFAVIASRQRLVPPVVLEPWIAGLLRLVGPDRLLWGSEAPVLYWRDETVAGSRDWLRSLAVPDAEDGFFGGNAARLVLRRPAPEVRPLELGLDPLGLTVHRPSELWPLGTAMDPGLVGRLTHHWIAAGAPGTLGAHAETLLDAALGGRPA